MRTVSGILLTSCLALGCGQTSTPERATEEKSNGDGGGGGPEDPVGSSGGSPNYADFPDLTSLGGAGPTVIGDPMKYASENGWVEPESPDDRPVAPDWSLDERWGDPGWKDSDEPFCTSFAGLQHEVKLWADETGVFGMFASGCAVPLGGNPDLSLCRKFGYDGRGAVQFNDGDGWQTVGLFGAGIDARIAGFPNGRRVAILGATADGEPCPLSFMDFSGRLECSSISYMNSLSRTDFIGVGPGAGYFFQAGNVHLYNGSWHLFGGGQDSSTVSATFASEALVAQAGADAYIAMRTAADGGFEVLPKVPTGDYSAIWVQDSLDLWALNRGVELVHFKDGEWEKHQTSVEAFGPTWHMWGDAAGRIYYGNEKVLARWSDGAEEVLIEFDEFDGRTITSVAPVSAEQIFVSIFDNPANKYQCGGAKILWFDGELFHQF